MNIIDRYLKDKVKYWLILAGFMPLLVPHIGLAQSVNISLISAPTAVVFASYWPDYEKQFNSSTTKRTIYTVATAYNSEIGQTDSTPFITANGSHVRDGIIAANMLPFGTKVRLPDIYGQKVFTVEDRMNQRYSNRIDIWMAEKSEAKQFGVRYIKMEVL